MNIVSEKLRERLRLSLKSEWPTIAGLCLLAVAIHIPWFNFYGIITGSDWGYYQDNVIRELYRTGGTWSGYNKFGDVNIQLPFYTFMLAWSALGNLGLSFDIVAKLTFFIPIAILNFLSPYFLIREITKNRLIAFIVAIFYGTTTYGITNQPPIQFVYALAPLVVLFFIRAIEINRIKNWLYFALIYSLGIAYEVRIMYIVTIILVLYLIFFRIPEVSKKLVGAAIAGGAILLLNTYWLLPTIKGGAAEKINQVVGRGLFGNNLYDLAHALALSNWSWTGSAPNVTFIKQDIPLYLWIIPLIIFGTFFVYRKLADKRWTIFFLTISLLGVFLAKQVDEPFARIYPWLYSHLPGFSVFREASKFFLLVAFGYMGLLAINLQNLMRLGKPRSGKLYLSILATLVVAIGAVNARPLITGEIGGLSKIREQPSDYSTLNSFLKNTDGFARTYWLPNASRWGYYSQNMPKVGAIDVINDDWRTYSSSTSDNSRLLNFQSLLKPFEHSYAAELFANASIRYVILPLRDQSNDDDFFKFYGDDREYFKDKIKAVPWLTRVPLKTNEVEVYENKKIQPYIRGFTELFGLKSTQNLDEKYDFITNQLAANSFDYLLNQDKSYPGVTGVADLFDNLAPNQFSDKGLVPTYGLTLAKNNTIYQQGSRPSLSYSTKNGITAFKLDNANSLDASPRNIVSAGRTSIAQSLKMEAGRRYYAKKGDAITELRSEEDEITLGSIDNDVLIYMSDEKSNLVPNPSFEDGPWKNRVEDCNAYDTHGDIAQALKSEAYDGQKTLELTATKHTACTSTDPMPVSPGSNYALTFNYKIIQGQRVGYSLQFDDPANTKMEDMATFSSDGWKPLTKFISAPAKARHITITLKGYPNDRRPLLGIANFDNVNLTPLMLNAKVASKPDGKFVASSEVGKISAPSARFDYKNLVPNPSFENGLWQKKVGDCNAYDSDPRLKMTLSASDHSAGAKSLELRADKHVACTGPNRIPVKEGYNYFFSFDYRSPTRSQAGYYLSFNGPNGSIVSEQLPLGDLKWHTVTKNIVVPSGAAYMTLSVYSYADEVNGTAAINDYDNFRLTMVPDLFNRYYLVEAPTEKFIEPKKVSYAIVSPTKKRVHIKGAQTAFFLAMAEQYNSQWRLEITNNKVKDVGSWLPWAQPNGVSTANHFKLNDFTNGWYIDINTFCRQQNLCTKNADDTYDLEMTAEFVPQRWFYTGLMVSASTLVGCLAYLTFTLKRRKDRNHDQPQTP